MAEGQSPQPPERGGMFIVKVHHPYHQQSRHRTLSAAKTAAERLAGGRTRIPYVLILESTRQGTTVIDKLECSSGRWLTTLQDEGLHSR